MSTIKKTTSKPKTPTPVAKPAESKAKGATAAQQNKPSSTSSSSDSKSASKSSSVTHKAGVDTKSSATASESKIRDGLKLSEETRESGSHSSSAGKVAQRADFVKRLRSSFVEEKGDAADQKAETHREQSRLDNYSQPDALDRKSASKLDDSKSPVSADAEDRRALRDLALDRARRDKDVPTESSLLNRAENAKLKALVDRDADSKKVDGQADDGVKSSELQSAVAKLRQDENETSVKDGQKAGEAKSDKTGKVEKSGGQEKSEKTGKVEESEKANKAGSLEKSEKDEKVTKAEVSGKAEKSDKVEKDEKTDKAEKAEKADKVEKSDKAEKDDKVAKSDKGEKLESAKAEQVGKNDPAAKLDTAPNNGPSTTQKKTSKGATDAVKGAERFYDSSGPIGLKRPAKRTAAKNAEPKVAEAKSESAPQEAKAKAADRFYDTSGPIGLKRPAKRTAAKSTESIPAENKVEAKGAVAPEAKNTTAPEGKAKETQRFYDSSGPIGLKRPTKRAAAKAAEPVVEQPKAESKPVAPAESLAPAVAKMDGKTEIKFPEKSVAQINKQQASQPKAAATPAAAPAEASQAKQVDVPKDVQAQLEPPAKTSWDGVSRATQKFSDSQDFKNWEAGAHSETPTVKAPTKQKDEHQAVTAKEATKKPETKENTEHKGGLFGALESLGSKAKDVAGGVVDKAKDVGGSVVDKAKDVGGSVVDKAKDVGGSVVDKAKDVGGNVVDKAKDVGGNVVDKAKDVGGNVVDKAKDVGGGVVDKAKDVGGGVVDKAKDVGGSVVDKAKDTAGAAVDNTQAVAGAALGAAKGVASVGKAVGSIFSQVGGVVAAAQAEKETPVKDVVAPGSKEYQDRAKDLAPALSKIKDPKQREEVEKLLVGNGRIDDSVLKAFGEKGSVDVIPDSDKRLKEGDQTRQAVYNYDNGTISLAEGSFSQGKLNNVVLEELAHFNDDRLLSNPATSQGWNKLTERGFKDEQKGRSINENSKTSEAEYASEIQSAYWKGPKSPDYWSAALAHPKDFKEVARIAGRGDLSQETNAMDAVRGTVAHLFGGKDITAGNQHHGDFHTDDQLKTPDKVRGPRGPLFAMNAGHNRFDGADSGSSNPGGGIAPLGHHPDGDRQNHNNQGDGSTSGAHLGGTSLPGGAQTGGAQTGGAQTGGAQTGGAQTGGAQTGGAQTGGAQTGGAQTGGAQTGGAQTGGAQTGGAQTGGAQTGGAQTGGAQTGGAQTGGAQTGGAQTGGAQTGGAQTGGAQTGGAQTGGAHSIQGDGTTSGAAPVPPAGGAVGGATPQIVVPPAAGGADAATPQVAAPGGTPTGGGQTGGAQTGGGQTGGAQTGGGQTGGAQTGGGQTGGAQTGGGQTQNYNQQNYNQPNYNNYNSQQSNYDSGFAQQNQQANIAYQQSQINGALDQIQGQLNAPGSAFQDLQRIDSMVQQTPQLQNAMGDLNQLASNLGSLKDLPQVAAHLESLADMGNALAGIPDAVRGGQHVTDLLQQVKDLPKGAKLEDHPQVASALKELPKAVAELDKLPGLVRATQELPAHMDKLKALPEIVQGSHELSKDKQLMGALKENVNATAQAVAPEPKPKSKPTPEGENSTVKQTGKTSEKSAPTEKTTAVNAPTPKSQAPLPKVAERVAELLKVDLPTTPNATKASQEVATKASADKNVGQVSKKHEANPSAPKTGFMEGPTHQPAAGTKGKAPAAPAKTSSVASKAMVNTTVRIQEMPKQARDLAKVSQLAPQASVDLKSFLQVAQAPETQKTLQTLKQWATTPAGKDHPAQQALDVLKTATQDPALKREVVRLETALQPIIGKQSYAKTVQHLEHSLDTKSQIQAALPNLQAASKPEVREAANTLRTATLDRRTTTQLDRLHSGVQTIHEAKRASQSMVRQPQEPKVAAPVSHEPAPDLFGQLGQTVHESLAKKRLEVKPEGFDVFVPRKLGGKSTPSAPLDSKGPSGGPVVTSPVPAQSQTTSPMQPMVPKMPHGDHHAMPTQPVVEHHHPSAPNPAGGKPSPTGPVVASPAKPGYSTGAGPVVSAPVSHGTHHAGPVTPMPTPAHHDSADNHPVRHDRGNSAPVATTSSSKVDSAQQKQAETLVQQTMSAQVGMQAAHVPVAPQPAREAGPVGNRDISFKQSTQAVRSLTNGKGTNDQIWSLVYHSRSTEGAKGLMDTLETTVVKGGSKQMQKLFEASTRNADATLGFSSVLANISQSQGDRLLGTVLLTTDGPGGKEAVHNLFSKMAEHQDSSVRLGQFLENSTKTQPGVRGLTELLDNWTQPEHDLDWSGANQLGSVLSSSAKTIVGSRSVGQALQNIGAEEGGGQTIARTLNRMSRSKEGSQEATSLLQNLAFDQNGAAQTSKLLARASQSRDGARQVLDSFLNMTKTPSGVRNVGELFNQLADAPQSANIWANFAKDTSNTGPLAELMGKINASPEASAMLGQAFEKMADNPKNRGVWKVFEGRMETSTLLSQEFDRANESASEASNYTKSASSVSSTEETSDGPKSDREAEQEFPARAAAAEASGQLSRAEAALTQRAVESQNLQNMLRSDLEIRLEESRHSTELYSASEGQSVESKREEASADSKGAFRPGDYYSEETLKQAKICGQCGYRTTSLGFCPRCAVNNQD